MRKDFIIVKGLKGLLLWSVFSVFAKVETVSVCEGSLGIMSSTGPARNSGLRENISQFLELYPDLDNGIVEALLKENDDKPDFFRISGIYGAPSSSNSQVFLDTLTRFDQNLADSQKPQFWKEFHDLFAERHRKKQLQDHQVNDLLSKAQSVFAEPGQPLGRAQGNSLSIQMSYHPQSKIFVVASENWTQSFQFNGQKFVPLGKAGELGTLFQQWQKYGVKSGFIGDYIAAIKNSGTPSGAPELLIFDQIGNKQVLASSTVLSRNMKANIVADRVGSIWLEPGKPAPSKGLVLSASPRGTNGFYLHQYDFAKQTEELLENISRARGFEEIGVIFRDLFSDETDFDTFNQIRKEDSLEEAFSPDGKNLVFYQPAGRRVRVYNVATKNEYYVRAPADPQIIKPAEERDFKFQKALYFSADSSTLYWPAPSSQGFDFYETSLAKKIRKPTKLFSLKKDPRGRNSAERCWHPDGLFISENYQESRKSFLQVVNLKTSMEKNLEWGVWGHVKIYLSPANDFLFSWSYDTQIVSAMPVRELSSLKGILGVSIGH